MNLVTLLLVIEVKFYQTYTRIVDILLNLVKEFCPSWLNSSNDCLTYVQIKIIGLKNAMAYTSSFQCLVVDISRQQILWNDYVYIRKGYFCFQWSVIAVIVALF
jgi:hypothetical protein